MKSLKKRNKICGVHINGIKGKDQKTKNLGKNPFDYLGIRFTASDITATLFEWKNGKWNEYAEVDGSASYRLRSAVNSNYRGGFFQLSKMKKTYLWNKDDGYDNFSKRI